MPEVYLSREGYEKLRKELEYLKKTKRREISKAIGEARAQGDLSENAEYDAAKDEQGYCEARIAELGGKLSEVRIVEDLDIPSDKVYIGAIVTLNDLDSGETLQYTMVSPEEADYDTNKLSILSPIGKGLMGNPPDVEVEVQVPAGVLHYKIVKIERP
ncbi:MAG: transcription elongation factor GreA [Candidatus Helarchaeales archaeon]